MCAPRVHGFDSSLVDGASVRLVRIFGWEGRERGCGDDIEAVSMVRGPVVFGYIGC